MPGLTFGKAPLFCEAPRLFLKEVCKIKREMEGDYLTCVYTINSFSPENVTV